jgi:hypothetical protein
MEGRRVLFCAEGSGAAASQFAGARCRRFAAVDGLLPYPNEVLPPQRRGGDPAGFWFPEKNGHWGGVNASLFLKVRNA